MKRKLVTLLLSLCMLFGITGLAACSVDTGTSTESTSSGVESGSPEEGAPENGTSENEGEAHTHAYTVAKKDATHHWTECECGEKSEKAAHDFTTKKDSTHHWTECTCGEATGKVAHDYTIAEKDATHHWTECTCGEIDEKVAHDYVGEWQHDETHHWKVCACGGMNKEVHYATEKICDTCTYLISTQGLEYTLSEDETYYSVKGIGTATDTDIVIPSIHNGLPVKEIRSYAFDGYMHQNFYESLTIPDSVIFIGDYAFCNCSLKSVTFGDNSQLESIGEVAFMWNSITSISIPDNVREIGHSAFMSSGLRNVILSENSQLTTIGEYAFSYNSDLTSVTIPDSVTTIGECAFV